ncbi:MAG: DUF7343 domain-containing protein [Desulfurococcaceae archaeon]
MKSLVRKRIIELLKSHQGEYVPQSYIHKAINASKSRVSEVLSELEREGLISRTTIGRSKLVYVHPGIAEHEPDLSTKRELKLGLVYSSEYLYLGGFAKRLARRGIRLKIVVLKSGIEAARLLANGSLDLALAPLVSQLYLYPMFKTYKIVPKGLRGGFKVLQKPGSEVVYSSLISTMDYVRYRVMREGLVSASKTVYFNSSDELFQLAKRGGFAVAWHPLYVLLEEEGFRQVLSHEDLDLEFCCTLAVSNTLTSRVRALVEKSYEEAIREYEKQPERYLEYYSLVTGISYSTLKSATREYKPAEGINAKVVDRIVESFAPVVPDREAYYQSFTEI